MKKIFVDEVDKEFKSNVVSGVACPEFANALLECNKWTSKEEDFIRHFSVQLYTIRTAEDWTWFTEHAAFPRDSTKYLLGMAMTRVFGGYEAIEMDIITPSTYGKGEEYFGIAVGAFDGKLNRTAGKCFYSFCVGKSTTQSILTGEEYNLFCDTGNRQGFVSYIDSLKTEGKDGRLREMAQEVIDSVVAYRLEHDTNSLYLDNDKYIRFLQNMVQKSTIYKEK